MDHNDNGNQLITERREKLTALRALAKSKGAAAFPNDFKPKHHAADLHQRYGATDNAALEPQAIHAAVAGRMMLKRVMGRLASPRCKTLQAASSSTSRKTRSAPRRWPTSRVGIWATSSAARARCFAPRPVNSRSRRRRSAC
jgi:hypothetical protein